ncbi:hypothetical protein GIB67_037209 [Kingdonia uniflora]|uniref:Glutaminyl-peptide cyclotransferase n=1 Tax=Kingdonia uniflora TaxID=39325 RepID=A0A7J7MRY0_9MAGN|nr:hypothetical protein GIB67_037209 [Kingdonia uniflora]
MATSGSTKKKLRRPNSQHSSPSSMGSPSSLLNLRRRTLFLSITLVSSALVFILLVSGTSKESNFDALSSQFYSIEVVNEFPHDPKAFTQGLLYGGNDTLFESTGLYKESSVRKVHLQSGKVEEVQNMDGSYFGEGLTLLGERLFQVTWLEKTGFIYDRHNLSKFEKFTHQMQDGWGLATDGEILFGSDGSSILYQLDSETLKVKEKVKVRYKGHEVYNLNELEYVNGEVWANLWGTDCIAKISHKDGIVLGWIILPELRKRLLSAGNRGIDVLNGIAWDSEKKRLFVTGKLWPTLYEIKLHPVSGQHDGAAEQLCLRRPAFSNEDP